MDFLDLALPAIVFLPFAAAAVALALGRFLGRATGALMVAAALGSFALVGFAARGDAPAAFRLDWIPSLGVGLDFRGDGFGLFFAALVSGIGGLVGIYSIAYVPDVGASRLGRYYGALTAFMGAMLGIALADDLILIFVFWEMTSVTSFLLIGFWYEDEKARKGALAALQVTGLGGLALMAGFLMIGAAAGTFTLSEIVGSQELRGDVAASPLFLPAMLLVLAGAFTKSAQVPFHFWLPGAMVAPTPVSAYLHAATMVKAGVFLLGRMSPIFGDAALWAPILISTGLVTFALGAWQAFNEDDLKGLLARTTVSTLGLVTMLYGLGGARGDALQVFSHAAYKGALFLVVGTVEHATHTRKISELGGLRSRLPVTFAIAVAAALSMAGVPPFLGFVAKEALYTELLDSAVLGRVPALTSAVIAVVVLVNALLFAVAAKLVSGVFLGEKRGHGAEESHAHGESLGLWLPPAILAVIATGMGLLGATHFTEDLVRSFSSAPESALHVGLVPDQAGPFVLSVATIALGVLLFLRRSAFQSAPRDARGMQGVWDDVLDWITRFANVFAARWQNGSLRWYFSGTLAFAVALALLALGTLSVRDLTLDFGNVTPVGVVLCALVVAASAGVVGARTRLAAAITLSSVGFLVALTFVVYRSPDILLTQILIETVSTIFILLVLYFMPVFREDRRAPAATAWNAAISIAVGVTMFLFVLFCTDLSFRETNNLAKDYLSRSLGDAGGSNAVNVIIVDFRAMDTTGEITVLVVVGLCVYGALRARRLRS